MAVTSLRRVASALAHRMHVRRAPPPAQFSTPTTLGKAELFIERYREVVSDPLNLVIERVPEAGYVDANRCVILHNGNRVPVQGDYAYYREFSDILIINRGVHEPLEEFCFQQVLRTMPEESPVMLEMGAYWAHYSMWMKKRKPGARCIMVEPIAHNIECGRRNFALNGFEGEFIQAFVNEQGFKVDRFAAERGLAKVHMLHADIQGAEVSMLDGAKETLAAHKADYVFISTHSEQLHADVIAALQSHGYRVEVSSGFDTHTTSCDGFVLATAPHLRPLFNAFRPWGRMEIARASSPAILDYVTSIR